MGKRSWKYSLTAALAVVLVATAAGPAVAQTGGDERNPRDPRTITVHASGIVRGIPDVMELTLGVETRARSAAEALERNSDLARKVLAVLKLAGVPEPDLQTSNLSVSPVYDDNGTAVIAYAVSNFVSARIRELESVGKVVDAATEVAGDEIVVNGLYFSFDDNTELVAKAREDAVRRAREASRAVGERRGGRARRPALAHRELGTDRGGGRIRRESSGVAGREHTSQPRIAGAVGRRHPRLRDPVARRRDRSTGRTRQKG